MSEWISIKDKLPTHGQIVLCYQTYPPNTQFKTIAWPLIGCPYQICEYGTFGNGFYNAQNHGLKYVTHWMPLPNPPGVG